MNLPLILVAIGILGLLVLFFFKSWQLKTARDLTSSMSSTFERKVQEGAKKTSVKLKGHISDIKQRAVNNGGKAEIKRLFQNNPVADLIKGKRIIDRNSNSSSTFLNDIHETKREVREKLNGGEEEREN